MSIRVMSAVWSEAPYKETTLIVLLALADWSSDDGECWPKIAQIAKKSRTSERGAQWCIKKLLDDGAISIASESSGPGSPRHYQIGVQYLHPSCRKGVQSAVEGVQLETEKGCNQTQRNKEEPSLEPLLFSPKNGEVKTDGRYPLFVADLNKYWDHTNTIPFSFGSPDGRAVKAFLKSNPKLTQPSFQTILQNRTRSDRVAHSEPIHRWLGSCLKYASGPLDEFNKPKSNGRNGMDAFEDADTVIARMAKGASVGR